MTNVTWYKEQLWNVSVPQTVYFPNLLLSIPSRLLIFLTPLLPSVFFHYLFPSIFISLFLFIFISFFIHLLRFLHRPLFFISFSLFISLLSFFLSSYYSTVEILLHLTSYIWQASIEWRSAYPKTLSTCQYKQD